MRPDQDELDDEIRGHMAISVKDRIERGEDPEAARLAALREFGNVTLTRDSMRAVWRPHWFEMAEALWQDIRVALRSLSRAKGLATTVVLTLALGIGANAAIFSVVRAVLLRPLVNRDEDRLIYIRQGAPDLGAENMTFSVPEINDFKSRVKTLSAFGDFSTVDFTMIGLGNEPRMVKAGVVGGSFFEVMGLRPVLGRLLNPRDDGPNAAGAAVLTYRFWTLSLNSDPTVIGRTVRLGPRTATIVGVLEPSVPYPADTEIIANVVTSPHHLGATMVTSRTHRMTELFGRLAPTASVEAARAELTAVHAAFMREHPEAYSVKANVQLRVTKLRDQIAAPARTILLVLLAAAAVVFVIACSNVANLILARSVRREGELAVRAALGAGTGALRRTLLAESLVLCGGGAVLGVLLARPLVAIVARYAARFSVRALEVTVDASMLWISAGLAIAAAILLAFVPRLPSAHAPAGLGLASGGVRITPTTNRRLRIFATTQIAFSFMLLAGTGMLLATLVAQQSAVTGYDMRHVLAVDIPSSATGVYGAETMKFYEEATRRIGALPGVEGTALGMFVPWRDAGAVTLRLQFAVEGYTPADGEENPYARFRIVSPRFFAVLGVPLVAGREFTDDDRGGGDPVAIVSKSFAQQLFANGDAVNRRLSSIGGKPRRIVGVVADVDDVSVMRTPAPTVYEPVRQVGIAGRLFVRAAGNPYALVPEVNRTIRAISADQVVERAATLEDVRAEVLSPERLNAFVFSGFAGIALLIAVVGVAGVLAFSVSARTREFGVRLAVGSAPRQLIARVLSEGVLIAALGSPPAPWAATRWREWRPASSRACSCRASCRSSAREPCSSVPQSWRPWCLPDALPGWTCCRHSDRNRPADDRDRDRFEIGRIDRADDARCRRDTAQGGNHRRHCLSLCDGRCDVLRGIHPRHADRCRRCGGHSPEHHDACLALSCRHRPGASHVRERHYPDHRAVCDSRAGQPAPCLVRGVSQNGGGVRGRDDGGPQFRRAADPERRGIPARLRGGPSGGSGPSRYWCAHHSVQRRLRVPWSGLDGVWLVVARVAIHPEGAGAPGNRGVHPAGDRDARAAHCARPPEDPLPDLHGADVLLRSRRGPLAPREGPARSYLKRMPAAIAMLRFFTESACGNSVGRHVVEPLRVAQLEEVALIVHASGKGQAAVERSDGRIDVDVGGLARAVQLRTRPRLHAEGRSEQHVSRVLADRHGIAKQHRELQIPQARGERASAGFVELDALHHELQLRLHGEPIPERYGHEPAEQGADLRGCFRARLLDDLIDHFAGVRQRTEVDAELDARRRSPVPGPSWHRTEATPSPTSKREFASVFILGAIVASRANWRTSSAVLVYLRFTTAFFSDAGSSTGRSHSITITAEAIDSAALKRMRKPRHYLRGAS